MSILDNIKKLLSIGGEAELSEFDQVIQKTIKHWEHAGEMHYQYAPLTSNPVYAELVSKWDNKKRVEFILYCGLRYNKCYEGKESLSWKDKDFNIAATCKQYIYQLFRRKLDMDAEDVTHICASITKDIKKNEWLPEHWSIPHFLNQLKRQYKKGIPDEMAPALSELQKLISKTPFYDRREQNKLISRISEIVSTEGNTSRVAPFQFLAKDAFAEYANPQLDAMPDDERQHWNKILHHAQKANGARPSARFSKEATKLVEALGVHAFLERFGEWMRFVSKLKNQETRARYTHIFFISGPISDVLKGLVWTAIPFTDTTALRLVGAVTERAYKKIPGIGPGATALGNACIYHLFQSGELEGLSQLSRLRLRIRQANTQKMILRYLEEAGKKQGLSLHEIEDMAVDDFGLKDGTVLTPFGDYQAKLSIEKPGKVNLIWMKPDGKEQKSVPAFVKKDHPEGLKELRANKKELEKTLSAQRDRIDRLFRSDRKMDSTQFKQYYLNHGLLGWFSRKLIWTFEWDETKKTGMLINDSWTSESGELFELPEKYTASLWHPVSVDAPTVKAWRNFVIEHTIQQPLKQAYREVYLLTDAEISTKSYSNRMAAHVLKQHQFNSLAKIRGWKYSLMGAYDDGIYNDMAKIELPEYSLRAEYWVNELNAEDAFNDTGIWNYITTDQVRFINTENDEVTDLIDIPRIPFSEVMRDVDLFVGVASVGNDPEWRDSGGLIQYRDYWEAYAFGDLTEVAKNRKEILERLLPRLKIRDKARIEGKFLIVKGKIKTYKIHIGSTNILMEPNDQYLCIVPGRQSRDQTSNVFLPFEGDRGLSIILSKAFMLVDDDKITDPTITRQIQ